MAGKHVVSIKEAQGMIDNLLKNGWLLTLTCRAWGNRTKVAEELVKEKFGNDAERIRAVRDMIDPDSVRAITQWQNKVKQFVADRSSRWFHAGIFPVVEGKENEVEEYINESKEKVKESVEELLQTYDAQVAKSKEEHPELYAGAYFPSPDELRAKFSIESEWRRIAMPMNGSKASVFSKEVVEKENAKYVEKLKVVGEESIKAIRESFLEIITHLRDILKDPSKKFKDTTIEKPKEFLRKMADIKLPFNDEPFDKVAEDMLAVIEGVFGEDLRSDDEYREAIGEAVNDVVEVFKGLPVVEIERFVDF